MNIIWAITRAIWRKKGLSKTSAGCLKKKQPALFQNKWRLIGWHIWNTATVNRSRNLESEKAMMLKISRAMTAALTTNGRSMKKYIISFFLILYSGICMANDIQIRRYSPSLTIDSELSYPIYLAVNTAVNKSYDIKQYNISVNKGWEEDGELYYIVGFIHKDYSENQRGGSRNFTIFIRRSDYRISFYLSR